MSVKLGPAASVWLVICAANMDQCCPAARCSAELAHSAACFATQSRVACACGQRTAAQESVLKLVGHLEDGASAAAAEEPCRTMDESRSCRVYNQLERRF